MATWLPEALRLSVVLLVAAFLLIATGVVGLGAGPPTIALYLLAVGGLFARRRWLGRLGTRGGWPLGFYGAVIWLAPLVATAVALLALGASPGEVQALGGIVGLIGMANYFLRPVYYALARLAHVLGDAVSR